MISNIFEAWKKSTTFCNSVGKPPFLLRKKKRENKEWEKSEVRFLHLLNEKHERRNTDLPLLGVGQPWYHTRLHVVGYRTVYQTPFSWDTGHPVYGVSL